MSNSIPDALIESLGFHGEYKISKLAGHANDNYLITVANRKIVIKCLGEHTPENEQLEGEYREYLSAADLPVSPFLRFADGNYVFTDKDKNYVALDYVEGEEARDKVSEVIMPIANIAARLHSTSYASLPDRVNWLDGSFEKRVSEVFGQSSDIAEELSRESASFPDFWDGSLPKGIVHGDLHGGNIIIDKNDQISTIIDWEEAGIVPVILDIAGMVQSLTQGDDGFDMQLFKEYFDSYQKVRKLSKVEKEVFPEAIRYLSFITYTWALWKHSIGAMGADRLSYFKNKYYSPVDVPIPN